MCFYMSGAARLQNSAEADSYNNEPSNESGYDTGNIAENVSAGRLMKIGSEVLTYYNIDKNSRAEWMVDFDLASKAMVSIPEGAKNYPIEKASQVKYPALSTACLQFAARSVPALVRDDEFVKIKTQGQETPQIKARADRVASYMSFVLRKGGEWAKETDALLHQLPLYGKCYRKVFYDYEDARCKSVLISAKDVVVNNDARSIEEAPRITHEYKLYPHEILTKIGTGEYLDVYTQIFGENADEISNEQKPEEFLEQHGRFDMDEDGYAEPCIVYVHKSTGRVVRIDTNYDENKTIYGEQGEDSKYPPIIKATPLSYFVDYDFIPDPRGRLHGIGLNFLLLGLGEAVNSTLNSLLDSAHIQNSGGGFVSGTFNNGQRSDKVSMAPNRYTVVKSIGRLQDNIMPLNHPGPSPVMFQILEFLLGAINNISSVKDVLTGDASMSTMPVGTVRALIEQGMTVYSSIYQRIYASMRREFKLVYKCISENFDAEEYMRFLNIEPPQQPQMTGDAQQDQQAIVQYQQAAQQYQFFIQELQNDFNIEDFDICPVADPKNVTDMQRMAEAQFLMQFLGNPAFNQQAIATRVLKVGGIKNGEELLAQPDPMQEQVRQIELQKAQAELAKAEVEVEEAIANTRFKLAQAQERSAEALVHEVDAAQAGTDLELRIEDMRLRRETTEAQIESDADKRILDFAKAQDDADRFTHKPEVGK